jgi:hypothetical protein
VCSSDLEEAAEKLSVEKAQTFFDSKIRKENFMFNLYLDKRAEDVEFLSETVSRK